MNFAVIIVLMTAIICVAAFFDEHRTIFDTCANDTLVAEAYARSPFVRYSPLVLLCTGRLRMCRGVVDFYTLAKPRKC